LAQAVGDSAHGELGGAVHSGCRRNGETSRPTSTGFLLRNGAPTGSPMKLRSGSFLRKGSATTASSR
jgi:hypothetical protein